MVAWTSVPPEPSDWVCEGCEPAFEAGRLAAIRADVDLAAWQAEQRAIERRAYAVACRARQAEEAARGEEYESTAVMFGIHAERADARANDDERKAADCRRWLEATS